MVRGEPGQAGTFDPKKGGKFSPGTKAGGPRPDSPDHGAPGEKTDKQKKERK